MFIVYLVQIYDLFATLQGENPDFVGENPYKLLTLYRNTKEKIMKYYQAEFTITPYREVISDLLVAMLGECGFEAFVPTDKGFVGYIQQKDYRKEEVEKIVADYPDHKITYSVSEAPDEDWNQTWEEEGFEPVILDDLVCVHDTRHADFPSCRYDIIINPRMAFGTGTHPTTQQILRHLCEMKMEGLRVVDAGCGTGVLGLLCAKRGAKEVFAYDIDEWSAENTKINAELNDVQNIIIKEGDSHVLPQTADYDLLIANINRNILLGDMERFAHALKMGGQLLLSGFYEADVPMLVEKGKELSFRLLKQSGQEGWAMVVLNKDKI